MNELYYTSSFDYCKSSWYFFAGKMDLCPFFLISVFIIQSVAACSCIRLNPAYIELTAERIFNTVSASPASAEYTLCIFLVGRHTGHNAIMSMPMNTAILYYSSTSGHTKQLVDAIAGEFCVDAFNLRDGAPQIDLDSYDLIGIASGIYYASFHPSLLTFISSHLPPNKRVFIMFTAGGSLLTHFYCKLAFNALFACHSVIMGRYNCLGHCTCGLLNLFGGISKGHPDDRDIHGAVEFYRGIQQAVTATTTQSPA